MIRPVRARLALLLAAAMSAAVAGCSSPQDEPRGLSESEPVATQSDAPSGDASASGTTSPPTTPADESREPDPTFTQPFVPGEPSVVEIREQLPVDVPDDATAEEQAVLEATGRFMASWDALLFGAGEDRSGIHETATGEQLARLVEGGVTQVMQQTVTVGEPTVIDLNDVTVDGATATVDICITMKNWVKYTAGEAEKLDEVERQLVTMVKEAGDWRASNSVEKSASSCS